MSIEEIIHEANEDLRHENIVRFWKRYSNIILGSLTVIILLTAAYSGWKSYARNKAENEAYVLSLASVQAGEGKIDIALSTLEPLVQKGSKTYKTFSLLKTASLKASQNKIEDAQKIYEQITADSSSDETLRHMATLLKVNMLLDSAKPESLLSLTHSLKQVSSFKHSALELEALIYHKSGDKTKAKAALQDLMNDDKTPHSMRSRLGILLSSL
jgi:hypothetical protein